MSLPGFGYLSGAWFLLALVPLVVLYFLKLKRPRMEISSLALWQSVVNDQRVNSPFQKFRRNLLLLLQILLLTLLVLALMQPFISAGPEDAEFMPVLIDCSASMSAVDPVTGESRLDAAKDVARRLIRNIGNRRIALFSFASGGRRLTEFTNDQTVLLKAVDRIEPAHRASRLEEVLRMADAYSKMARIQRVVVVSDGNLPERVEFDLPFEIQFERVPAGDTNIGITEFNARRSGPDSWDVFVRVAGSSADPAFGTLSLLLDGQVIGKEELVVSSDDSERVLFSVNTDKAALLEARISPEGDDALALDNSAWLSLPHPRPLRVRVGGKLYSWQHAVSVLADAEIDTAPEPTRPEYDCIVTESDDLQGAAAPVTVYVGVVPRDVADLVSVSETADGEAPAEVVDWIGTNPILRHVRLRDVQIAEKTKFAPGITAQKFEERGYEVIVHGAEGPLVLQRRRGLQTDYYFLFHTDRSTLPYRLAFPILVSNIAETARQQASLSEVSAVPTGVLPALMVEPSRQYVIRGPDGFETQATSSENGLLAGVEADRVGRYDILDGNEIVRSLGTGILSELETSLRSVDTLEFAEELKVETQSEDATLTTGRQLWWLLAFAAFILLLAEWWFFQRPRTEASA